MTQMRKTKARVSHLLHLKFLEGGKVSHIPRLKFHEVGGTISIK